MASKLVENSCCEGRSLSLRKPKNVVLAVRYARNWPTDRGVHGYRKPPVTKILMSVSERHTMACPVRLQTTLPRGSSDQEGRCMAAGFAPGGHSIGSAQGA